jgi:hypothetical protein
LVIGDDLRISIRCWFLAIAVVVLTASSDIANALDPDFAPGQVWSIKSPVPTTAKVVIGLIEPWHDKIAVHVRVIDIPAPASDLPVRELTTIDHVPFEKSALMASVDQLLATGVSPTPEFKHGYDSWRNAGNAGIFEIGVSQAIAIFLERIRRRRA